MVSRLLLAAYVLLAGLTVAASVATAGFMGDTLWGALAYGPLSVATIVMYCWRWR